MFTKGDKYIHFTKYGGVNKGEVDHYGYTTHIDTINKVSYITYRITNTAGITLQLDGSDGVIYKIENEYTDEQCTNIKNNLNYMGVKKDAQRQHVYNDIILPKGSLLDMLNKKHTIIPKHDGGTNNTDFRRGKN